jgi:glycosyltransferase involved in cell wall biosynthesis
MKKLLFVVPTLQPCGAAKQVSLLAPGLPRSIIECRVCVLGRDGPFRGPLRDAGIAVEVLGWTRRFDLGRLRLLRRLVRDFDPEVIHVWGTPALALMRALAGGRTRRRIIVSNPLPSGQNGRLGGWLLRQADLVVAGSPAEAERCRQLGVTTARIAVIAPSVGQSPLCDGTDPRRSLRLPCDTRLILCAGPLEPHKGFLEAVWAYHTLTYVYTDMSLLIIGDGSERHSLEKVARRSDLPRVFFLGPQENPAALLSQADVVMVPSLSDGGVNVLLEGMAAGRAIIASNVPSLSTIVEDGHTGLLVPPGDKAALARQTRLLFNSPQRRRELGEAAQAHVRKRFALAEHCRQFTCLYESVAA